MSESPADHYAWAEALIAQASNQGDYDRKAHLIAVAQVHATLATVDPDRRPPARQAPAVGFTTDDACICPRLPHMPAAITALLPDCPIHKERRP